MSEAEDFLETGLHVLSLESKIPASNGKERLLVCLGYSLCRGGLAHSWRAMQKNHQPRAFTPN